MWQLIILFISIISLAQVSNNLDQQKIVKPAKFEINTSRLSNWPKEERAFYQGSQTGEKAGISRELKKAIKKFGIIHLLTPSGIHLSSILLFIFLFVKKKFRIIVYFILFILFYFLSGFYSLKRIIYFHLINTFLKNSRLLFLFTFLLDIILGGYYLSPLSFIFSFLFWGIIIFHKKSKIDLVMKLFFAQLIISYFFHSEINILALIINPLITSIFSFVFPVLSINFWLLPEFSFDSAILFFFKTLSHFLLWSSSTFSFLDFLPSSLFLALPFIYHFKPKYALILSLCFISPLNINPPKRSIESSTLSYSYRSEVLRENFRKIDFYDRKCKRTFMDSFWEIQCKKKPSKFGGLSI